VSSVPVSELIPVNIEAIDVAGRVTAASEVQPGRDGRVQCTGAAVVISRELFGALKGRRLQIELKCDFIASDDKFPVDGDFLLGALPTGNRVPGGTFWSWVRL
jgi:hypothetical protein